MNNIWFICWQDCTNIRTIQYTLQEMLNGPKRESYKVGLKINRNKMNIILPSCSCVSTAVWLHHLNSNKIPGEEAKWE